MKLPLYNIEAKEIGQVDLPAKTYAISGGDQLLSQSVRVYLQNQRRSHAKTLSRGEVSGTTKKMWAQKGTGRARHGSAKAPIFVGGGTAHGPRGDRNFKRIMPPAMSRQALRIALTRFAKSKTILVIDDLSQIKPSTKAAVNFLAGLKTLVQPLNRASRLGIVIDQSSPTINRAFNNLSYVQLLNLKSLSTYNLLQQDFLILTQSAIKALSK